MQKDPYRENQGQTLVGVQAASPSEVCAAFSAFAARTFAARPDVAAFVDAHAQASLSAALLETRFAARLQEQSALRANVSGDDEVAYQALCAALRLLRADVFCTVMARDLLGLADVREVTATMSDLAELAVSGALTSIQASLVRRFGEPCAASDGARLTLGVVGMGKLGGRELNVSSDIDLIFVYEEEGQTSGGEREGIENHDFFTRVGRKLIAALSERTAEGYVFRVDMRLRPNGDSGPLVCSLAMLESYFFAQGREWERYAWIKGRLLPCMTVSAGASASLPAGVSDPALHAAHDRMLLQLEQLVRPFVFRRYLDFGVIDAIRSLHKQIEEEAQRRARLRPELADDVKLGRGGIREIEFGAQVFQLVRGGQDPSLRVRPTLEVLAAAAQRGLIGESNVAQLAAAYDFLRRVEHRLQYVDDAQTHAMPVDPVRRAALAAAMGFGTIGVHVDSDTGRHAERDGDGGGDAYAALHRALEAHRDLVEQEFIGVFAPTGRTGSAPADEREDGSATGNHSHDGGISPHPAGAPLPAGTDVGTSGVYDEYARCVAAAERAAAEVWQDAVSNAQAPQDALHDSGADLAPAPAKTDAPDRANDGQAEPWSSLRVLGLAPDASVPDGSTTVASGAVALGAAAYGIAQETLARLGAIRLSTRYAQLPSESRSRFDTLVRRALVVLAPSVSSGAGATLATRPVDTASATGAPGSNGTTLPASNTSTAAVLAATAREAGGSVRHRANTLARWLDLLDRICGRRAYLALLTEYPAALRRVLDVLGSSAWAADYLIKHPQLLDELLDHEAIHAPFDWPAFAAGLRDKLAGLTGPNGGDVEQQMDLIRHSQHAEVFRILLRDLSGLLSVEAVSDRLSELADTVLDVTLAAVWRAIADRPKLEGDLPRFAIIAYGKLGGKELGYGSDLDLIFLYDDQREGDDGAEHYTRLARRLISWLTTATGAGQLYDVDLRLRPNGSSGLLVTPLDGFRRYQRPEAGQANTAWVWEHQAVSRARYCAGDRAIGAVFEEIREAVLASPRDPGALAREIVAMRERIREGHPNRTALFDLKHDLGGMVDIEFLVQYGVLRDAGRHPRLIRNSGNLALLDVLAEIGFAPVEQIRAVQHAYRRYRVLQHWLRLDGAANARVDPHEVATERADVRALWEHVFRKSANGTHVGPDAPIE